MYRNNIYYLLGIRRVQTRGYLTIGLIADDPVWSGEIIEGTGQRHIEES